MSKVPEWLLYFLLLAVFAAVGFAVGTILISWIIP